MKISKKYLFFLFLFIIMILGSGLFICYKKSSNSELAYWEYMMNQDPKPKNISEEDYFLGNQKGMCWRDNKIYSKDELTKQAMQSFIKILLAEIELEKNEKVPNDMNTNGDYHHGTARYCNISEFGCKLWYTQNNLLFNEIKSNWHQLFNTDEMINQFLIQNNASIISKTLPNPMENYFLIHKSFFGDTIYPSDCCKIIDREMFQSVKHKKMIIEPHDIILNNQFNGDLSQHKLLKQYGLGDFYFIVKSIKKAGVKNVDFYENHHIYFVNNCGNVLIKPYFSFN